MVEVAAEFRFGAAGNGRACLVDGWCLPEAEATWSSGGESVLRVPLRPGQGDLMLELAIKPFIADPLLKRQRLGVSVDGADLAEELVEADTVVGYRLPAAAVAGRDALLVRLRHPDAASPAAFGMSRDARILGFQLREVMALWVAEEAAAAPRRREPLFETYEETQTQHAAIRGLAGLPLHDLMMRFESLGHNCEFGLVQRRGGAEPLGLLRFASISYRSLIEGLDFGFEGVDDPALLRAHSDPVSDDIMVVNERYGLMFHTFQHPATTTEDAAVASQVGILEFRRRQFLEILGSGEKLFVFHRRERMSVAQAMPILTLLRSYGPNALLFVTRDTGLAVGTVTQVAPHLFQGSMDRFAPPDDAQLFDFGAWVSICANAHRLWREGGDGAG